MTTEQMIELLKGIAGGLNDGHARWPVPELAAVIEGLRGDAPSYGVCDDGPEVYELGSVGDHCVEEGKCWEHCADRDAHEVVA